MLDRLSSRFILPLILLAIITIVSSAKQPAQTQTPAPTSITLQKPGTTLGEVASSLALASGIPIAVPPAEANQKIAVDFIDLPFWDALDRTAKLSGTKIVLLEKGTKVSLQPRGNCQEISSVNGPFRVVAKQVIGRSLLDIGATLHDVYLEVHWEPRIPVFRLDSQRIVRAEDDRGIALQASLSTAKTHPTEAITEMKISLRGLTRKSQQIGILAGEFQVAAAAKLQMFKFQDLAGKLPVTQKLNQVEVTLKSIARPGKFWEVEMELQYPSDHPAFESFEELKWTRDTRVQLVDRNRKPFDPESDDVLISHGRRIVATYRFPGNLNPLDKGWSLACETPSPLVEFKVPFELKNIPLP